MAGSTPDTLTLDDIQGNILRPYKMPHARYLFLRFGDDAAAARGWLRAQIAGVTTAATWSEKPSSTLNLAFSHHGLTALGLGKSALDSFPEDFRVGMAARADVLGDTGASEPEGWGPINDARVHAVVILHAVSPEALEARASLVWSAVTNVPGLSVVYVQDTAVLVDAQGGRNREHFGYVDGISQPAIVGVGEAAAETSTRKAPKGEDPIEAGAFILGQRQPGYDTQDIRASSPDPEELRRNGTYVVVRKLKQDVFGFRRFLEENRGAVGGDAELLAAKMMGRWRSGAPLSLAPHCDDPELGADPGRNNDFTYSDADDQRGLKCPFQAHIRRANPRDTMPVADKTKVATHTLIRRGMPYGPWLPETPSAADLAQERGMLFVAFNASIASQFEVKQRWLNSGNVAGSVSAVRDPIVGSNDAAEAPPGSTFSFVIDPSSASPAHTLFGIPRFVTVRGGGYFFMPGIGALHHLADLPAAAVRPIVVPAPGAFLGRYDAIEAKRPAPGDTGGAGGATIDDELGELLRDWVLEPDLTAEPARWLRYGEAWSELRAARPVFETPFGYFVSGSEHVQHVLSNGKAFSVRAYGARMADSTGAFFLGFDVDSPQYKAEAALARKVIKPGDDGAMIPAIVEGAAAGVAGVLAARGRGDRVDEFAIGTLERVIHRYFGVPGPDDGVLFRWLVTTSVYIFHPVVRPEEANAAAKAGSALSAYVDRLIEERRKSGRDEDDVLGRLLRETRDPAAPINDVTVRRMLVGMVSGMLVPTTLLFLSAILRLSADPDQLAGARLAAANKDRDKVLRYLYEAARFAPQPDQLHRVCVTDTQLPGCDTQLRADRPVIVSLGSAMMDPAVFPDPERFSIERDLNAYRFYGFGKHECLGRHLAPLILQEMGLVWLRATG